MRVRTGTSIFVACAATVEESSTSVTVHRIIGAPTATASRADDRPGELLWSRGKISSVDGSRNVFLTRKILGLVKIGVIVRKSPGQREVCGSCARYPLRTQSFPHHCADPRLWTASPGEKGSIQRRLVSGRLVVISGKRCYNGSREKRVSTRSSACRSPPAPHCSVRWMSRSANSSASGPVAYSMTRGCFS